MRSTKLGAALLAGALVLAACGDDGGSAKTTTAAGAGGATITPVTADTLTVVTSLPAPGFFNGEDPADISGGLEYGLAKAIAAELGLANVKVINTSFDSIVAGAVTDKFDIIFSQVTITDERKKVVTFSTPYFDGDQGILVKKGTKVATLADAQKLQWGVQTGTTGEALVTEKVKPAKEAQSFQDLAAAYTALNAGQVDAVIMDTTINLGQAAASGGKLEVVGQFKTGEQYGAIYPKDSKNVATIDAIIKGLVDDGTVSQLSAEWLGGDPASVPVIALT
ncbi:MAG: ABC transporter substrate-binding protein [Acidimicrobiia bacterium]